MSAAVWIRSKH